MKKGYYIHFNQKDGKSGVSKKIDEQINVLKKYFDLNEINIVDKKRTILRKILSRLPFGYIAKEYNTALSTISNPDFIYIRRTFADRGYYLFIKKVKKIYPNVKILIEIYTYPYDKDDFGFHKGLNFLYYPKDVMYRKKLRKYIDRYVTYSIDNTIFKVKTINILNGIDFNKIPLQKHLFDDKTINIVALGIFQNHSGYDRIIKGLGNYYKTGTNRDIKIFFIGKDISRKQKTVKKYNILIEKYNLAQRIEFCGYLTDEEQTKIFEKASLALGSFGAHRDGIMITSELKSRTYLARGIPIVAGCGIDVINNNKEDFFLKLPADDSDVNFEDIINFYDVLYSKYKVEELQQHIRKYGEQYVDINNTFLPVINYINGR